MRDNDIQIIRDLIERWYDADLSSFEERELISLLERYKDLPPDIHKDRDLIMGLDYTSLESVELPEEYHANIIATLEEAITADKEEKINSRKNPFAQKVRFIWIAASVLILVGTVGLFKLIYNPGKTGTVDVIPAVAAESTGHRGNISHNQDTLLLASMTISKNEDKKINRSSNYIATEKSQLNSNERTDEAVTDEKGSCSPQRIMIVNPDDSNPSHIYYNHEPTKEDIIEVERIMASRNYKVVTSEEEAEDLINSIFTRVENNIAIESGNISRVRMQYNSEMSRVSDIETLINFKETAREKSPI